MLKKRKFDVILEDGKECRVWTYENNLYIGQEVTGTRLSGDHFVVVTGIIKEIIAINGMKQK